MKPVTSRLRSALREPLVQFLLAGAALLAAQKLIAPATAQPVAADQIVVSSQAVESMKTAFAQENRRAPTAAEVRGMIDKHIDGEVLYREALRYGLDRTDVIVRREMQRKMRFLIEEVAVLPAPTPVELQAFLDAHAERYARPDRISFEQVFLSRGRRGERLQFDAGRALAQLRSGQTDFRGMGDPSPAGSTVADADRSQLEKDLGGAFTDAVMKLPSGQWSDPIRSSLGLHIVRVTGRKTSAPVSVGQAGQALVIDVQNAQRERANRQALDKLRARYRVEIETGAAS
jgi:hypothetical protein